jgi:hypothetical protein
MLRSDRIFDLQQIARGLLDLRPPQFDFDSAPPPVAKLNDGVALKAAFISVMRNLAP